MTEIQPEAAEKIAAIVEALNDVDAHVYEIDKLQREGDMAHGGGLYLADLQITFETDQ